MTLNYSEGLYFVQEHSSLDEIIPFSQSGTQKCDKLNKTSEI